MSENTANRSGGGKVARFLLWMAAAIAAGFVGLVILGLIVGGDDTDSPQAAEPPVVESQSPVAISAAPVESTPEASASPEPAPEPSAPAASSQEATEDYAATVEATVLELRGLESWGEPDAATYGQSDAWPDYVNRVETIRPGQVEVFLDINSNSPDFDAQEMGDFTANSFFAIAGPEHPDLETVRVTTTDGLYVAWQDRDEHPLLD